MSNQCSNYRSFSFCTPLKPYATTLRPFFPFQHNLISTATRSRRISSLLDRTLAAQSSSDIVLIAKTEHRDGSLVFRFGDASEVVENDEQVESQTEEETSVVKVLDGDQDSVEVADIGTDIAEGEANAIRDLSDGLSDISENEVLLSQSDANMKDSLKVVERTLYLDEARFSVQLDEEVSADPTIYLPDISPNIEESADPEGTLLKGSDDETVDPSVSVELESTQVSEIEVMDDLDKVETEDTKISDTEDVSVGLESTQVLQTEVTRESDTEDTVPSAFPATMQISDIELVDAANGDMEEELNDMIIDEGTLIDELHPSNPLDVQLMDAVNENVEEEFKDTKINEAAIIDETPSSDQLVVEPTLNEVSELQSVDFKYQTMEDELQQVRTKIREENDVAYAMSESCIEEAEGIVEDEGTQPQSTPPELKPTIQVLSIDFNDTVGQNLDDGILQVENEVKDPSVSVKPETIQVSDNEVINVANSDNEVMESKDSNEGDAKDLQPPATMHVSDDDFDERLQNMNISKAAFIEEMLPSTLEVSSTKGMDVNDLAVEEELQPVSYDIMDENEIADVVPAEPVLEEEVSQPHSTPVELQATMQVSDIKVQDATSQNLDDKILQAINEDAGDSYIEDVQQSPRHIESYPVQDEGVKYDMLEQCADKLQDMNINECLSIDEMPTSDPLGAEPTLQVSTAESMDLKDLAAEDELQLVRNDNMDENEISDLMPAELVLEEEVSQPHLTPVELKATMQVSDSKVQDATCQNLDSEILQVINEDDDAGDSDIDDVEQSSNQLESQPVQDERVKHNVLEQCAKSDAVESSILLKQGAHDPLLEAERTKGMVGSSELAEASEVTALLLTAEAEAEREEIYLTDGLLLSGAALIEHPLKELTGGDDAYFVAGSKWLGVADGVSQWSFEGTGPGLYAQELMRTCEEIVLDTSSIPMTNPVELLCRGVKETNMSGSSNVLIANFNGQVLHVANIGDTGFFIIRHGSIYKKSSPLLHEFHFALQVEDSDDPLQLVEEYLIELEVGDIVVSATDGLFDNLYEREITMIVSKSLQAGMKPEEIANVLATRAQEVGKSAFVRSPFSDAAQAAGYTGYAGGKPDNVVVIVSLVEKGSNLLAV